MFTQSGKNIVAKFLIGQVPTFASHIAFGCGVPPLGSGDTATYSPEHVLKFETFRSKIISRGYVNELVGGVLTPKVVFTAEMPTDNRYEITEMAIFPAQSNTSAGSTDSKMLVKFSSDEPWVRGTSTVIPTISDKLGYASDKVTQVGISNTPQVFNGGSSNFRQVFFANSDNPGLDAEPRLYRKERPRFLNESIFIFLKSSGTLSESVQASGLNIDLSKNSPSDLLKLAFSVLSDGETYDTQISSSSEVYVDFYNASGAYYRMTAAVDNSSLTNRYNVAEVPISSLVAYPSNNVAPTLSNINKIVVSAKVGSSDNGYYWIALDGLRIDNISSNTATYDMVAYSQIKNYAPLASNPSTTYATPIVKDANSSNFVEFRFGFGV